MPEATVVARLTIEGEPDPAGLLIVSPVFESRRFMNTGHIESKTAGVAASGMSVGESIQAGSSKGAILPLVLLGLWLLNVGLFLADFARSSTGFLMR